MTTQNKPWKVFPKFNKEQQKQFNAHLDNVAAQLGYAIGYSSSRDVFDIDTLENLQKTVQSFKDQDASCGCCKASTLVIMPVAEVHWKTRRSLIQRKIEIRYNLSNRNDD
jgi:hypothetical protein